jgi:hypothetical protein
MELPADAMQKEQRMIFAVRRGGVRFAYGGGVVHRAFGHS